MTKSVTDSAGSDSATRIALGIAHGVGFVSRAWNQKGLGTLYLWLSRLPLIGGATCRVEFAPEAVFETPVFDSHWSPVVVGKRPYEPELRWTLELFRDLDPVFVDCGANWGYWSVVVTGADFGWRRVIAVEANPSTFGELTRNAALNGNRFTCLLRAVSDRSGVEVALEREASHLVTRIATDPNAGNGSATRVSTITIDDAVREAGFEDAERCVIKLDVEGHEMPAIRGAARVRSRDHAIIFEEFAAREFSTLREVLAEGYAAFYVPLQGGCRRLRQIDDARRCAESEHRLRAPLNLVAVPDHGVCYARLLEWSGEVSG